jgi:hypothetical protein
MAEENKYKSLKKSQPPFSCIVEYVYRGSVVVANQEQLDRLAALLQLLAVGGSCCSLPPSDEPEEQLPETRTNMTWMELDPVDVEGTFSLLQSEDPCKFSAVVGPQDDSPQKFPPVVARKSAGAVRQRRTPKRSQRPLLNGKEKVSAEVKKESAPPGVFLQPDSQQTIAGRNVDPY